MCFGGIMCQRFVKQVFHIMSKFVKCALIHF